MHWKLPISTGLSPVASRACFGWLFFFFFPLHVFRQRMAATPARFRLASTMRREEINFQRLLRRCEALGSQGLDGDGAEAEAARARFETYLNALRAALPTLLHARSADASPDPDRLPYGCWLADCCWLVSCPPLRVSRRCGGGNKSMGTCAGLSDLTLCLLVSVRCAALSPQGGSFLRRRACDR